MDRMAFLDTAFGGLGGTTTWLFKAAVDGTFSGCSWTNRCSLMHAGSLIVANPYPVLNVWRAILEVFVGPLLDVVDPDEMSVHPHHVQSALSPLLSRPILLRIPKRKIVENYI